MVDILNFPSKSDEEPGHSFLHGMDNTVSFDADGHLTLLNGKTTRPRTEMKDWTNQELASLYRVKGLLVSTGYSFEVDRGVTDEGDPWFVFCNSASEVFIHLCRIDGEYWLDSPNLNDPLRGRNFTDLVDSFVNYKLPQKDQADNSGPRVVKFTRGGPVYLHPSAMLAALIWTLLLASDELVIVLPEQSETNLDVSDTSVGSVVADVGGPIEALIEDTPHTEKSLNDTILHGTLEVHKSRQDTAHNEQKLGQGAYFVGLNAIAISLGLLSKDLLFWGDGKLRTTEAEMSMTSPEHLDTNVDEESSIFADIEFNTDLLLGVEQVLTFLETALVELAREIDNTALLEGESESALVLTQVLSEITPEHYEALPIEATYSENPLSVADEDNLVLVAHQEASDPTQMESHVTFGDLLLVAETSRLGELREFQLDGISVQATFSITENDFALAYSLVNEVTPQPSIVSENADVRQESFYGETPPAYDQVAQEFINHLISRDENFEMISTQNELILLDLDVLTATPAESYLFTWTLADGTSISAIGLRADFQQFDLIA